MQAENTSKIPKIGIVGSRSWTDPKIVAGLVSYIFPESFILISGGCKNSPDEYSQLIYEYLYFDLAPKIYYPEWEKYGNRAGFIRNTDIAIDSDFLTCFWDPASETSGCLDTVKKMGSKPSLIITPDLQEIPVNLENDSYYVYSRWCKKYFEILRSR